MTKAKVQQELKEASDYIRKLEEIIYSVKRMLWDSQSYKRTIDDVLPEIEKRLKIKTFAEGEAKGFNEGLMLENERLWYMVRVLSKDETVKENGSPFGRGRF
jgi:hypothetical protein